MGTPPLLLIVLLGVCALLGAALLAAGIRGRVVSRHPHCRKCKFDLVGLAIESAESRCPECGAELRTSGAVRQGLRRKRPVITALGVLLLLAPPVLVGIGIIAKTNIHAYKPDFWLMYEARYASSTSLTPQLAELLSRMQADKLGGGNRDALILRTLEVQADDTGGWDTAWGNILDFAAANSLLTEEQLKQNARNAPDWSMHIRPTVVEGDDWVASVHLGVSRVGNAPVGRLPLVFQATLSEIRSGDRVLYRDPGVATSMIGIHSGGGSATIRRLQVPAVEPGSYEVIVLWDLGIAPDHDQPSIVTWTEERTARIKILPKGTTSIELVDDPGMRERVLKALSLSQGLRVSQSSVSDASQMGFGIRCMNPPMDLAFDLIARERLPADAPSGAVPREWLIGSVAFSAGGSHNHGGGNLAADFDPTAVDLLLRPSVKAAQGTLSIYKIWNGEVVFRDVPLIQAKAGALIDPRAGPQVLPTAETP